MIKLNRLAAVIGLTTVITSAGVYADDHQFELNGALGYHLFDGERDIDDDAFLGLGLGYVINPRWTLEAWWTEASTEAEDLNIDVDATEYRLDALYHFAKRGDWTPFLVAGVGDMTFDLDNFDEVDETRINLGLGVKRALTDRLGFRGDLRAFNSLDHEDTDFGLQLGLNYALGKSATAAPVTREIDSDGDGVLDSADACPNTLAGAPVDGRGCPLDSDRDGVYDYMDECPNTARNLKVDAKGCPLVLTEKVSIELRVNFDNDSDVVKPEFFEEIRQVADFMNQYANTQVEVQGHTDARGAADYNKQLSQRRADAVAKVLVTEYGIEASRVSGKGYGEEQPIASNDTAEGRAANRRVVAEISAQVKTMQER
jgi:OOP family OmpA-OmpF porin